MRIVAEVTCWPITMHDTCKFECIKCGPTNHVIRDNTAERFVCCACEPAMARALSRVRLTS